MRRPPRDVDMPVVDGIERDRVDRDQAFVVSAGRCRGALLGARIICPACGMRASLGVLLHCRLLAFCQGMPPGIRQVSAGVERLSLAL
jgi:hypothetical protein